MAAREEIREGLAKIWWEEDNFAWIKDDESFLWKNLSNDDKQAMYSEVDKMLSYLRSKGVVIRVDRELPKISTRGFMADVVNETIRKLNGAGYVAVEELIDEDYQKRD